jgi:hypothetical protein
LLLHSAFSLSLSLSLSLSPASHVPLELFQTPKVTDISKLWGMYPLLAEIGFGFGFGFLALALC